MMDETKPLPTRKAVQMSRIDREAMQGIHTSVKVGAKRVSISELRRIIANGDIMPNAVNPIFC